MKTTPMRGTPTKAAIPQPIFPPSVLLSRYSLMGSKLSLSATSAIGAEAAVWFFQ